jgi:uncharacterized YigZ family protein
MHRRLYSNIETQQILKKSTFIVRLERLLDADQISLRLQALRRDHPKASHVCFAYRSLTLEKYSDDGEPSKTAGLPMLQVLRQADLIDVLAIVIRYYGGIPLGAPGLTRAYRSSVALALKQAQLSHYSSKLVLHLNVELENAHLFMSVLDANVMILHQHYQDSLDIRLALEDEAEWLSIQQRYPKALNLISKHIELIEH